jgi:ATP-dependent DNA helicase DinG
VRRKNRLLISLNDGPNLSKSSDGGYDAARAQSNEILYKFLKTFKVKSLVLFRGYNDHKAASISLSKTDVKDRIFNIEQGEEPDQIDEKIKKLRSENIVLSSASSRLWEGVDIPNLRLVIIDALPYPGKDPLDQEYNFRTGYLMMLKRLKQGLGRIVRSDDDWGAAIVIDRRFEDKFSSLKPKLPWYMGDDFKHHSVDNAIKELDNFIKSREEGIG